MLNKVKEYLSKFTSNGIALAFSGGVDSSLLLAILSGMKNSGKFDVMALTMASVLHSSEETSEAERLTSYYGIKHKIMKINPLGIKEVEMNQVDRCYWCKRNIFSEFVDIAHGEGIETLMDGTNADDLNVYRPGRKAIKELGVISPFAELGIKKADIREMAAAIGLEVASKPAAPCLATRFAYGTRLTDEKIFQVYKGEELVKSFLPKDGNVRLRQHGNIARIEIPKELIPEFSKSYKEITEGLKVIGFEYVTLDLEGFRSGSMDIGI